jgi:2-polyprenyl-6-methoxyphenol hydroxylase-like FAD-dependent oxidoreductase
MAEVGRTLIVGGGIAGLSLAAALGQHGFQAELVERNPDWQALGAGLLVQANGMRVLRRLGMADAVCRAGTAVRRWMLVDQQGEVLSETDLEDLWGDVGPCIGITRARLQRVLVEGAGATPCRLGTSITSLVEDDRRVSVTFTDGSAGDYDLVVGADGIHSAVRDHAMGRVVPTFGGQIVWRSLAPIRLSGAPSVQMWLGDGCFFGMCSVGDGHTYGFGNTAHRRHHDPVAGRLRRLRDRFAAFGPGIASYLSRLDRDEQVHCSPIEWVEQERWHTSRVVLIGDAAHASSPMMGQGGNLAIEDAWVLAEVLRAAPTVERALAVYTERRRPRVDWVHRESRAVAEGFRMPPQVRNGVLRERGSAMLRHRFGPLVENP